MGRSAPRWRHVGSSSIIAKAPAPPPSRAPSRWHRICATPPPFGAWGLHSLLWIGWGGTCAALPGPLPHRRRPAPRWSAFPLKRRTANGHHAGRARPERGSAGNWHRTPDRRADASTEAVTDLSMLRHGPKEGPQRACAQVRRGPDYPDS